MTLGLSFLIAQIDVSLGRSAGRFLVAEALYWYLTNVDGTQRGIHFLNTLTVATSFLRYMPGIPHEVLDGLVRSQQLAVAGCDRVPFPDCPD